MNTRTLPASDPQSLAEAAACLAAGGLVAVPTETVYGLAADAANGEAVARIFEAKGRPRFNPLISHVAATEDAQALVTLDAAALALAERFWPGPLTIVAPARPDARVHPLVSGGLPTLAVRMPQGVARDLIARLGRPLAAPSANRSGRVSPTTAEHVSRSLGGRIDLILDGGPTAFGLESTVIALEPEAVRLLRPGAISADDLAQASGLPVLRPEPGAALQSPGQMRSHYAPQGRVRLEAGHVEPGELLITFGRYRPEGVADAAEIVDLSPAGDLREAAANLFAVLNEADRTGIERIAVAPIPRQGLGEAINDRLRRAAAPRD
ncbi:L-threonylcarbamoyladenylate synthase [Aurantimonas sp. MSK8Z-1]|uniref:L-threonylcarbamoyladenylate synthase n=1 Tax=Mangrovibrevibacter kandeliae TaxID=2968473 RepID=UPI0021179326|nr:L-threonylcarbamoyladenylate synthase [Aurantimonas sp. MSK8Z-1]MCW4113476.1 L-threonylcarbamoyladenylate synthase [Aurantimonas sp. MSK8Z-1]